MTKMTFAYYTKPGYSPLTSMLLLEDKYDKINTCKMEGSN